jgi:hypothetical protein
MPLRSWGSVTWDDAAKQPVHATPVDGLLRSRPILGSMSRVSTKSCVRSPRPRRRDRTPGVRAAAHHGVPLGLKS